MTGMIAMFGDYDIEVVNERIDQIRKWQQSGGVYVPTVDEILALKHEIDIRNEYKDEAEICRVTQYWNLPEDHDLRDEGYTVRVELSGYWEDGYLKEGEWRWFE